MKIKILLMVCAFLVLGLAVNTWADSLSVDFEASSRSNTIGSPAGWSSFDDTEISGNTGSQTFGDISVTLTNETTGRHGNLGLHYSSWTNPPYVPSGSLAGLVQDHLYVHDSLAGDLVKIRMDISGLDLLRSYQMTTWHNSGYNHLSAPGMIDILVGETLVVDNLQQSRGVANSDSAAKADFSFTSDENGEVTIYFVATEVSSGPEAWPANGQCVVINGFELTADTTEPVIGFNELWSSGFENESPALIHVILNNPRAGQTYTVDYAAIGGTATDGDDYTLTPETLTFNPGETTQTISIDIINDGLDEADETIILELSNPTGPGALVFNPTHTYIIVDPRPKISFVVASSSGIENVTPALIEVILNKDDYGDTVRDTITVDYEVTGGTAVNGDKYILPPGTLSFPPGVVTQYITLDVVDDDIKIQPDETVVITLSNPGGPSVLGDITEYTYTFIENDEGIKWEGKRWYFTNEGKDNYKRLFINDDRDLEWWPQQKGQIVVRIGEQRLSQAGDVAEMSYLWMSDGPHSCSGCSCDCFEESITCVAGTSDFRVVLADADGEYTEHDGGAVGNHIYVGYKGIQFRFGPNMNSSPTRWVDCHGETHKTGSINKKPENSENLAHGNDDPQYRVLPGFELSPGKYSLFTLRLERTGSSIRASITLNGRTYDADISGGDQPQKIDVFAIYMRNGRPYTRVVLRSLKECPGDINRDFKVDSDDLKILSRDWLKQGTSELRGTEPDSNGLVMHCSFDGNLGSDVANGLLDDTGSYTAQILQGSNPGSTIKYAEPVPDYSPGTSAWFTNNNGSDNQGDLFVIPNAGGIDFSSFSEFTVSLFINPPATPYNRRIFAEYINMYMYLDTGNSIYAYRKWGGGGWDDNRTGVSQSGLPQDTWSHLALTWDADAPDDKLKLYLNGELVDSAPDNSTPTIDSTAGFAIGGYQRENLTHQEPFNGGIDEFKLYDYALSEDEIIHEANNGSAVIYTPPDSPANLYDDNIIDFRDFAVFASQWLETCE